MMTREHLESLTNEELLGEERMAELRGHEIDSILEWIEDQLNGSDAATLLGEECLEELRQQRIAAILEAKEEELEEMSDEELLGEDEDLLCGDVLEELREEEIERRLGAIYEQ